MSERVDGPGNFLRRWSQRKQAADGRPLQRARYCEPAAAAGAHPSKADSPAFDPTTLPPIESITAASDVRAFLAPGIPVELSRAALRRAWVTDPAIRDFLGVAENQWDFTKPEEVPGFGPLELTPEVRRIIAELVADPAEAASRPDPESQGAAEGVEELRTVRQLTDQIAEIADQATVVDDAEIPTGGLDAPTERSNGDAAAQDIREACHDREPARRRHGGALPKYLPK
jgi:hypothetical protein